MIICVFVERKTGALSKTGLKEGLFKEFVTFGMMNESEQVRSSFRR